MAKKRVTSTVLATNAVAEVVQTIHGERVTASELTHLAPYLHRFAIRVDALTRDPDNARKHGKKDLGVTASSMKRFGQTIPILFRPEDKVIIVGNGRHEAAGNLLDWTYIAAAPFAGTREQAKAYGLADNRTAELSTWDMEKLSAQLDELGNLDDLMKQMEDFTLEEIGLGGDDLEEIQEAAEEKEKKTSTAVEAKASESVAGQYFNIVIKCGSEKHQVQLLEALTEKNPKTLIRLLNGADIRTQN